MADGSAARCSAPSCPPTSPSSSATRRPAASKEPRSKPATVSSMPSGSTAPKSSTLVSPYCGCGTPRTAAHSCQSWARASCSRSSASYADPRCTYLPRSASAHQPRKAHSRICSGGTETGAPASGAPASGAPASGAPASGAPASGAPASGATGVAWANAGEPGQDGARSEKGWIKTGTRPRGPDRARRGS
jgi:probable phosphoglycerate mutase